MKHTSVCQRALTVCVRQLGDVAAVIFLYVVCWSAFLFLESVCKRFVFCFHVISFTLFPACLAPTFFARAETFSTPTPESSRHLSVLPRLSKGPCGQTYASTSVCTGARYSTGRAGCVSLSALEFIQPFSPGLVADCEINQSDAEKFKASVQCGLWKH